MLPIEGVTESVEEEIGMDEVLEEMGNVHGMDENAHAHTILVAPVEIGDGAKFEKKWDCEFPNCRSFEQVTSSS